MKTQKIKRYRLGVSRYFPTTHPRKGEPTGFETSILMMLQGFKGLEYTKIHTIRGNYELWSKRMAEVQAGRAVIELFYWSGSPYNSKRDDSKQVVFATLDKDSGCGVQGFGIPHQYSEYNEGYIYTHPQSRVKTKDIAQNDGLSLDDFKEWFSGCDMTEIKAIIHFTSFRY